MGPVIGDLLPLALGVALSPVPVIAVILMLLAPRAGASSVAFMLGWVAGVALVVTVVALLVPADADDGSGPATWQSVLKLVLGLLLLLMGVRQWRQRPRPGEEAALPGWMSAIDSLTPVKAGGLGAALAAANPKNLALCLSAGVAIGGVELTDGELAVCIVVFVVIASVSVAGPVLAYLVARERMQAPLDSLREWLTAHNAAVMTVLLVFLGVTIAGQGLGGLV